MWSPGASPPGAGEAGCRREGRPPEGAVGGLFGLACGTGDVDGIVECHQHGVHGIGPACRAAGCGFVKAVLSVHYGCVQSILGLGVACQAAAG
jgi:hypothetical protein